MTNVRYLKINAFNFLVFCNTYLEYDSRENLQAFFFLFLPAFNACKRMGVCVIVCVCVKEGRGRTLMESDTCQMTVRLRWECRRTRREGEEHDSNSNSD